jgi:outer membrane protein assembly factor BamB
MKPAKKTHLGWLGPAIVLVGIAASLVAFWYMRRERPVPGETIDTITVDAKRSFVIRKDAEDPRRSFLELHDGDKVKWQALIPLYAGERGRRAIAWSDDVVTVRVQRDGRMEVFAFAMKTSEKVGALRLAPEHEPLALQKQGPITLTDHKRSYEVVSGPGWGQLVAIDLDHGKGVWITDLGPEPITNGGIEGDKVWLDQGGKRKLFDLGSGHATE